ncbi:MAG TPA: ABC transporter substrate-binding protein [Casimicrobiaceae bacterium]|nr:ABC transporter substrate-binding protein [Casimicrobiaceae bacterium]
MTDRQGARRALAWLVTAALLVVSTQGLAADPRKVVRDVFPVAETGFDPAAIHDLYSAGIIRAIFETLYTYDYLARPAKLVPQLAAGMPDVSADGKVYTIKLSKGVYFQPDPAFGGKKRELTAEDVVYSMKRLADPKVRSPYAFLVEGKFVGLDAAIDAAKKSGKFDYDRKIPGLEVVDRYTVRFRMTDTDYNLPYVLAHEALGVLAREVVDKYAESDGRVQSNPVGTGPYKLGQWVRSNKIVLDANPDYRGFVWDYAPQQPGDDKLVEKMKGKKMPQVGRVEVYIMVEDQTRWLAFQSGELDLMNMEGPLAPNAIGADGKLKPDLAAKGVRLDRFIDPEIRYMYWNWLDPRVGGAGKPQIALRRALAMSYDAAEEARVVLNGQAVEANFPIPPGVVGHVPDWKSTIKYDPATANALLDKFGYKRGADGWRTWPDGTPMSIKYAARPDTQNRQLEELVKKSYDAIGVRMESQRDLFPELLKLERQCKLFSREAAWIADYPDGDNFMQLFYGPNSYQSNNACATIPEYDALYKKTTRMPPGPERDRLYQEMARILEAYAPHRLTVMRYRNELIQPRIEGYRKHPILPSQWQYIDVAASNN